MIFKWLLNYDGSEAETAADQQRRSAQAEARATTAMISDLAGPDLSPKMSLAKRLLAVQATGRKVMQDKNSSSEARTAARNNIVQVQREIKVSKRRIAYRRRANKKAKRRN